MENGKVPDLPPVADKSNVDSNENPTPISAAEERTEEIPRVDNETGMNADLNGSPTEIANAEETAEDPTHDDRRAIYFWILVTRRLLEMLQSSVVAEVGLEGSVRDSNGNLVPIESPEETLVQNEILMTREELLEYLQENYGQLQTIAAAEARRQNAERCTASSDVQTQTGLNHPASDCSKTDGSCQTDVSKSLSNVTPEPSTRNVSVDSLQCREDEQPVNDIGQDVGTSADIFVQGPRSPLELVSEVLDAFREEQCDMDISRNEQNTHEMTDRTLQRIPSTTPENQSDMSVAGTSGSVQSVPESSPSSSRRQRSPAKERLQEKENP